MNFISSSGPDSHLSLNSLQAAEATAKELQERSNSSSGPRRSAYAPPPVQTSFAPTYNVNRGGSIPSGTSRAFTNLGKRKLHDEDEWVWCVFIVKILSLFRLILLFSYFNDEDEPEDEMEYQPAPGSPAALGRQSTDTKGAESDDSDDPLDAYMQNIEVSLS